MRWWARFAGVNHPDIADHWFGASSAVGQTVPEPWGTGGMGLLAACGVFGEEARQFALRKFKPTVPQ